MSLDQFIEYLNDDELLEVTPESLRLRRRVLDTRVRGRSDKRAREAVGAWSAGPIFPDAPTSTTRIPDPTGRCGHLSGGDR